MPCLSEFHMLLYVLIVHTSFPLQQDCVSWPPTFATWLRNPPFQITEHAFETDCRDNLDTIQPVEPVQPESIPEETPHVQERKSDTDDQQRRVSNKSLQKILCTPLFALNLGLKCTFSCLKFQGNHLANSLKWLSKGPVCRENIPSWDSGSYLPYMKNPHILWRAQMVHIVLKSSKILTQEVEELKEKLAAAERRAEEAHQRALKHEKELEEGIPTRLCSWRRPNPCMLYACVCVCTILTCPWHSVYTFFF